jgi:hypothetical protein
MARSRRRKTTSTQRIAGLVALGLPAPMQRVADTRLGSLMMLIFIPAMIISGVLTVDWNNGRPTLNLDRNKAQQIKQKAESELTQWSQDGTLQNWQANVQKAWQNAQQNLGQTQSSSQSGGWLPQHPAWQADPGRAIPSTSPGGLASYGQAAPAPQQQTASGWSQWGNQQPVQQQQQPTYTNQPNYNNQPIYNNGGYIDPATGQPVYGQPAYGQPSYGQPAYGQPSYNGQTGANYTNNGWLR